MTLTPVLPTAKRKRHGFDPLAARVVLAGLPGVGKTTLAAQWAPDTTLIVDTHGGASLLDGEHYVADCSSFSEFTAIVDALTAGEHTYKTVVVDLIGDVYKFAEQRVADDNKVAAAALIGYGKGVAEAEAVFRKQVDRLLASPLGIWFLTHTQVIEDEQTKSTKYVPLLDKRIRPYIEGAAQFMWLAEAIGPQNRVLHTQPSVKFGAKSRVPVPDGGPLDARSLYAAIAEGTAPEPEDTSFDPTEESK